MSFQFLCQKFDRNFSPSKIICLGRMARRNRKTIVDEYERKTTLKTSLLLTQIFFVIGDPKNVIITDAKNVGIDDSKNVVNCDAKNIAIDDAKNVVISDAKNNIISSAKNVAIDDAKSVINKA